MISLIGRSGSLLLFTNEQQGVVVDADFNIVTESGDAITLFKSRKWKNTKEEPTALVASLVNLSLEKESEKALLAASPARMYTIPKAAQAEAKKALEWHKEHHRGGTPVGINTARTLAKGGQIGIEKVRHIAKYFPRHEVDKKGKGWKPGEDQFPSNGRIAWALWGGDSAWRWAADIVKSANNKAVRADGYIVQDSTDQINLGEKIADPFQMAHMMDETYGPEFLARVRLDGSGMDRLYKIDMDGQVYVWDDNTWDDLGHVEGDVWTYDQSLDDIYDNVEKSHILIDPMSAVQIAARMTEQPHKCVSVFDLDEDEAAMHAQALHDVDWDMVDYGMTAAGEGGLKSTVQSDQQGGQADDGYSPEERSKNASGQMRDIGGKFISQGMRAQVGKEQGTVTATDKKTGTATVKLDSGKTINIPGKGMKTIKEQKDQAPSNVPAQEITNTPIDTSGILGEPRTPIDRPNARIPGTLPAMTKEDLHQVLYDFPAWVKDQRDAFVPGNYGFKASGEPAPEKKEDSEKSEAKEAAKPEDKKPEAKKEKESEKPTVEVYDHPLLKKWLEAKQRTESESSYDTSWAGPVVASAMIAAPEAKTVAEPKKAEEAKPAVAPKKEAQDEAAKPDLQKSSAPIPKAPVKPVQMTPETSDVQPMYFAVVAPDDPSAVLDIISLVPASSTSTAPMVYRRLNKKWTRDEKTLADLKSATPPPVVPLDSETLNDVLKQVDGITASAAYMERQLMVLWGPRQEILTAAGGIDRNRGNAENLRHYWTHGEGAVKIKWGTPGDWKRCVRHLSKYMGVRAKGYCQLRHKEATGMYTATHAKKDRGNFAMEEVLTKNYGVPTVITDDDLMMPISKIMVEDDDIYDHHWEPDEITKLRMKDLNRCDDDTFEALTAAGGLDRNRGNAEELRRYWTVGKGAAKIRWGTGGDWTRCVRNLEKYMGPRAKGYCALRHKEVTGMWTGDKKHRILYGRNKQNAVFSTDVLKSSDLVIETATLNARARDAKDRLGLLASAGAKTGGSMFRIPLVIPEGIETGDGRMFRKGSISTRELPLPLLWQMHTSDGHSGSVVVGRIDRMERTDDGIGNAFGVFDDGEYGKEAERLVRHGFIRGVSADMDQFEAEQQKKVDKSDAENDVEPEEVGGDKLTINKARVMAVTMVPKPAFQECKIFLIEEDEPQEDTMIPQDGIYVEDVDGKEQGAVVASAILAGAIPVVPPTTWFNNPKLKAPTPITVDDDGRVFGHIAAWNVDHIGLVAGTKPPRSRSNYGYFHTGVIRTDNGKDIPVGQLTLAGGHASLEASALDAVKHYDDTGSAIADVHAGEDAYGIWVAGALRPSASPEQIRALRASAPSGDWRPIRGSLELVAVCQVNVPGFPIARARVASGAVVALVAAGANFMAHLKAEENPDMFAQVVSAKARINEFRSQRNAELAAKALELSSKFASFKYADQFADISTEERTKLAKKREAMPDGSYPIRNEDDLKNAIKAFGRAKEGDRAAVRRHIMRRARQLDKKDILPEKWLDQHVASTTETVTAAAEPNELRARVAAAMEALGKADAVEPVNPTVPPVVRTEEPAIGQPTPVAPRTPEDVTPPEDAPVQEVDQGKIEKIARDPYVQKSINEGKYVPGKTQPRDEYGKFRKVLARLKQDLGVAGLDAVARKVADVEGLNEIGSYSDAAKASGDLIDLVDRLDSGALNATSLENIRGTTAELGKVIANLPLPFDDPAQKLRYSDLPPALKNLMDDMISRVEDKIGKKDADIATANLRSFKSGADVYGQSDISSQFNKLLRLLT